MTSEELQSLTQSAKKYAHELNEFSRRAAEFLEHGKSVSFHEKEIEAMLHVAGILRGYLIELKRAKQVHP